jgi:hypothetical protein
MIDTFRLFLKEEYLPLTSYIIIVMTVIMICVWIYVATHRLYYWLHDKQYRMKIAMRWKYIIPVLLIVDRNEWTGSSIIHFATVVQWVLLVVGLFFWPISIPIMGAYITLRTIRYKIRCNKITNYLEDDGEITSPKW